MMNILIFNEIQRNRRRRVAKVNGYAEAIIPLYTDIDFQSQFHLNHKAFEMLLSRLGMS